MHTPARRAPWALLALLPLLAACDAATSNTFDLPQQTITFEFVFQGGALSAAQLNEVTSRNQHDLRAYVEGRGFGAGDIVAARIRNARMTVARPLAANVSHFSRAEIRTFQGTQAGTTLADGQGFSGGALSAPLEVRAVNFASTVATGPFQAQLLLQPVAGAILAQEYLVEVTMDVVIEVEG